MDDNRSLHYNKYIEESIPEPQHLTCSLWKIERGREPAVTGSEAKLDPEILKISINDGYSVSATLQNANTLA